MKKKSRKGHRITFFSGGSIPPILLLQIYENYFKHAKLITS